MGGGGGTSSDTIEQAPRSSTACSYYPEWYEAAGSENYAAGKAIVDAALPALSRARWCPSSIR